MRDPLQGKIRKKLQTHLQKGDRVLLGVSGGPDSIFLLSTLVKLKNVFPLELHVVHVDHGWRKESQEEALSLKKFCAELGVCFHLFTLDTKEKKTEDNARKGRFSCFLQAYKKVQPEALLLAQQADEQAETILKRILEGSSCIYGMKELTLIQEMRVLRPILTLPKKEILSWLAENDVEYFTDPTNFSSEYLRGKMRVSILPLLEQEFGKGVISNLLRAGKRAELLENYLETKMDSKLKSGSIDLKGFHPIEISYLNRKLELGLTSDKVETLIELVNQGKKRKKELYGKKNVSVSSSVLSIKK